MSQAALNGIAGGAASGMPSALIRRGAQPYAPGLDGARPTVVLTSLLDLPGLLAPRHG